MRPTHRLSDADVHNHLQSAEALGAISDPSTLQVLEEFCNDARSEVSETCQIASKRVAWMIEHAAKGDVAALGHMKDNPYHSIDPAPAAKQPSKADIPTYAAQLLDTSLPLFERYKAMFSLRNNGSKAAVLALCAGLKDASPLFRHEIAYVLGQLQHAASIPALRESVANASEHEMVRHEAAEALGAIGTSECVELLQGYTGKEEPEMLRESCQVALDVVEYWAGGETASATA